MTDSPQRTAWIDVLKGIAILFVVLGHNPFLSHLPGKVFNVIFSFHIPLFFFISGYLFNPNVTIGTLAKKRFNSLLRPYFFTLIVVSIAYVFLKSEPSFFWYLFWIVYGNGPNLPKAMLHLWFLPNLLLITVFTWFLFRNIPIMKSNHYMQGFTITILLITGVFMIDLFWHLKVPVYVSNSFITDGNLFLINGLIDNPVYSKDSLLQDGRFIINGLPWSMDIALISSAFFMGGYFIKGNKREGVFNQSRIAIIMLVLFSTLHIFFNDTIDLNLRRYDSLIISTLIACSAIYVCVHSSFIISNCNLILKKPLSYIGRYSLIIFIFHPIIQSKTYYAFISLYPNATHTLPFLSSFFVGMCTPLLLNWLIIERFIVFRYWYYAKTGS